MTGNIFSFLILTCFFQGLQQVGCQVCDQSVSSLSRQHVGVFLTPFLREESLLDGGNDLIPLVQQIHTRFSKIMVQPLSDESVQDQRKNIPLAVAKFNAMKAEEYESFTPLEVILEFKMPDIKLIRQSKSSGKPLETSLDVALEAATKANSIYSQTVFQLCFLYHVLSWSTIRSLKYLLNYARTKLANGTIPYKLGATLQLEDCEEEYLEPILPNLDFIFFSAFPNSYEFNKTVTNEFNILQRKLKSCIEKLKDEKISIGFHSTWSDQIWNGEKNVSNLVQFWNLMNHFAIKTNTTVIFFEAFDNPFREIEQEGQFGYTGWWKLKPNKKYASTAYFVFEEKCLSNYSIPVEPQENVATIGSSLNLSTSEIIVVSIGVLGILIGSVSLVSVLIYRKLWKKAKSILTKQEELEFFQGSKHVKKDDNYFFNITNGLPYDNNYELSKNMFILDETELLGCGTFGTVCLAKVIKDGVEQTTAVKKAQPTSFSLKSIMCEIKILSYLGKHENIVGIVGAYTAECNEGVMYLFLDLCSLGSLEKFLRKLGKNEMDKNSVEYSELSRCENTKSRENICHAISKNSNLLSSYFRQWCQNIVHAMEYLASKNVIHGDLATRNILLCRNLNAKICDFGLSRRMYEYTSYLKTNVEPLPWRWMAPESLLHWEFNEKTDVWAFGITVWEISTFGGVPYPGLQWSVDFASKLENGMRLSEPKNCIPGFYQLMKECWELNPATRPTFSQLSTKLSYAIVL